MSDLGRINDAQLSKLHVERLKHSLNASQRISPVLNKEETVEPTAASSEPPKSDDHFHSAINALSEKFDSLVAAIARPKARPQAKRGTSDFAKFGDRCLHCGSDKHRALECPVKRALLEKNGGKFPTGYKSAFDKWKAKQPKKSPVGALLDEEDDGEYSETDLSEPVWCIPQCAVTAKHNCACDGPKFEHLNPFAPIFDDDDDDDEARALDALKHISSNVTVGPKLSQKQKKKQSSSSPILGKIDIAQLAKLVRSGAMGLPDLSLQANSQYEEAWALVDSGAARYRARGRAHFPNTDTHLRPSHVKMATASGDELVSRGCFDLDAS